MAKWKPTDKQSRFIEEYLVDLNATQAAIRAGYSEKTARSIAQRLLTKVDIQEEIKKRQQSLQRNINITQERVLSEYAKIAFFDIRKLYDEDGKLKPVSDLDDDTASAIAGLEFQDSVKVKELKNYKIADKMRALDSLAKHLGMFKGTETDTNIQIHFNGENAIED